LTTAVQVSRPAMMAMVEVVGVAVVATGQVDSSFSASLHS